MGEGGIRSPPARQSYTFPEVKSPFLRTISLNSFILESRLFPAVSAISGIHTVFRLS